MVERCNSMIKSLPMGLSVAPGGPAGAGFRPSRTGVSSTSRLARRALLAWGRDLDPGNGQTMSALSRDDGVRNRRSGVRTYFDDK
jgi:hypothetical protein